MPGALVGDGLEHAVGDVVFGVEVIPAYVLESVKVYLAISFI